MEEVHEFISYRFQAGIEREAQFATMAELEPLMLSQAGLKLRETFYSERDDSWVTHLIWADEAALDAAGPRVEADPTAMSHFKRFDADSMRYARFRAIASAKGNA
jgi:hypothetical protein